MINLMIVDDHTIMREGLKRLFELNQERAGEGRSGFFIGGLLLVLSVFVPLRHAAKTGNMVHQGTSFLSLSNLLYKFAVSSTREYFGGRE